MGTFSSARSDRQLSYFAVPITGLTRLTFPPLLVAEPFTRRGFAALILLRMRYRL